MLDILAECLQSVSLFELALKVVPSGSQLPFRLTQLLLSLVSSLPHLHNASSGPVLPTGDTCVCNPRDFFQATSVATIVLASSSTMITMICEDLQLLVQVHKAEGTLIYIFFRSNFRF